MDDNSPRDDTETDPVDDNPPPGACRLRPGAAIPGRRGWQVLAILSTLMGFASISTDLYLPAMPAMSRSLHADNGTLELTVSAYLMGFAFGQLFWGPISDRHGRRWPVAIGIVLFVIGSAGCALSYGVWTMIGWRVVQAAGASAGVVLGRAMVRDLYEGDRAVQMMSTLMTVMAIAPLIGPFLGGQIMALAGWHAIFWTLVCVGLVTLASLSMLPETLSAARRNTEPLGIALVRYAELALDRRLLGYAGVGGFYYGGTFAYVAGSPFVYISYYHVPAGLYGLLFGAGITGIMIANTLNARLVVRQSSDRLLFWGTGLAAVSSVIVAVAAWTNWGGLWGLILPLFVFIASSGLIVANSIAGAMRGFPFSVGAVSALVGAIQYGSGILGSALVGAFADGTPRPLGCVIALAGIGSLACTRLIAANGDRDHKPG
ncbi:MFS transporter, DHA1 family, bicyclomycin/chloramphenicol resistance protein [Arboricoccus pini]|uniref:Bcr/CflA family efflux transporter n=1 Tax=Arboricoccus pini TaxID=1963835 RepID=A0A212S0W8_9PROT|nr:multidrug effflux MFS transporter [Arboricoccus pini]SNB78611.1 MFS transporter, DHA1 family, bicyclomycin/chloramphenicol resistance protein [Arboricoccus pini]